MPRNRINYGVQDLCVGPAVEFGPQILGSHHILQKLLRVRSVSYDITMNRTPVEELGNSALVGEPAIPTPDVGINFGYHAYNVGNEMRMGMLPNFAITGFADNPNNFSVSLLSGMLNLDRTRDRRNYYLVLNQVEDDIHVSGDSSIFDNYTGTDLVALFTDQNSQHYNLVAFSTCYLSRYTFNANVGNICECDVSLIGDAVSFYSSGSGVPFPKLDIQNRVLTPSASIKIIVPRSFSNTQPSALLPGDVTATILCPNYGTTTQSIPSWGYDLSDIKIQSYNLSIQLPRKNVGSLGYRCFLDRPVAGTVFAEGTFTSVIGDCNVTGDIFQLLNQDFPYNISVSITNPRNRSGIAVRHDFRGARIQSISDQGAVGQNKQFTCTFRVPLNPLSLTSGLFISGVCEYETFNSPMSAEGLELQTEGGEGLYAETITRLPNMF